MIYYQRDGTPCAYECWSELLADRGYRELQSNQLANGTRVETFWLGIDGRSFYLRPPRIDRCAGEYFRTAVA
jgi:hypothetical protein